jgi:hypothetical protein
MIYLCIEKNQMKLTFPLLNTTINVPVDETVAVGKKNRREHRRKRVEIKPVDQVERVEEESVTPVEKSVNVGDDKSVAVIGVTEKQSPPTQKESVVQPLLMVEVVNITHEKFRQTEEIKVYFEKNKNFINYFSTIYIPINFMLISSTKYLYNDYRIISILRL